MRTTPQSARRVTLAAAILVGTLAVVGGTAAFRNAASASVIPAPSELTEAGVVAIFDLANTADIETGGLGDKKASNKEVKDFGHMLSGVHTDVRQKGRDLAKKLGVVPAMPAGNTMANDHAAAMAKLRGLSGNAFDRAFLEHEQAYHAAVLDAVKTTLLPAIKNQELKDFVTSLAPAFEAHRAMAEHLLQKLPK